MSGMRIGTWGIELSAVNKDTQAQPLAPKWQFRLKIKKVADLPLPSKYALFSDKWPARAVTSHALDASGFLIEWFNVFAKHSSYTTGSVYLEYIL